MKTSRFTDSQIIAVLKQTEADSPAPVLCREHGMSSAAFYKWCSKFSGMEVSMVACIRELEEENRRLKKIYAEVRLSTDLLKEALAKKCMVRLAFAKHFLFDEGSLHKCIRPLASGLRLQPGHDEIRTHRSQ